MRKKWSLSTLIGFYFLWGRLKEWFIWSDNTFVPQIISLKHVLCALPWLEWLCSKCARPRHGANSWGWDAHSFSSVYHAGKAFQKLLSHKNSMHLNATAHFQSQVIFCDNTALFCFNCSQKKSLWQDVYRKLLVKCTRETLFIERNDKSSFGSGLCWIYTLQSVPTAVWKSVNGISVVSTNLSIDFCLA